MGASMEHHDIAAEAFNQVVGSYLRKRLGNEIAARLIETADGVPGKDDASIESSFTHLYQQLLETRLEGYDGPFLNLILDKDELTSLPKAFNRDFQSLYGENRDSITAIDAFDKLLAPHLVDILGEELVEISKNIYNDAIEIQVGVADHVRFFVAMDKMMETIPLLNEVEYIEQIRSIAETLKQHQVDTLPAEEEITPTVSFQNGVEQIIVTDLAEILGHGPLLESLIDSTYEKCSGVFPDDLARFSHFVGELNKSDVILNMFGDHWTSNKEQEWVDAFREMFA